MPTVFYRRVSAGFDRPENLAMTLRSPRNATGFSLIELLVVLGVVALLIGLLLPALARARDSSAHVTCLKNLRALVHALHVYAAQNDDRLPADDDERLEWDQLLARVVPELDLLVCPADPDGEDFGLSYSLRDRFETTPEAAITGRPLSQINDRGLFVAFEEFEGWHRAGLVNAATLDGAARPVPAEELEANLALPAR